VSDVDRNEFYGPQATNQFIRQALHPFPDGPVIVTTLAAVRGEYAFWQPGHGKDELIASSPAWEVDSQPRQPR
jgi:hypothetical protein